MNYYDQHSQRLFSQYNGISAETVHADWLHLLPSLPGKACDIGAGAGRDAHWLASLGWTVLAVEPSKSLRELAREQTHPSVEWLDDCLPDLACVLRREAQFDLVLISAVWMHLNELQRQTAMASVRQLLKPRGMLLVSLRFGPDDGRNFYPVSFAELQASALSHGLTCVIDKKRDDAYGREQVTWHSACFTASC